MNSRLLISEKSGELIHNEIKLFSDENSIEISHNNRPIEIKSYFKNKKLNSLTISIKQEYINKNYRLYLLEKKAEDNLTEYINFTKNETEELLNSIIKSKKRNFSWGKIQIMTDPRIHFTFIMVKYLKL